MLGKKLKASLAIHCYRLVGQRFASWQNPTATCYAKDSRSWAEFPQYVVTTGVHKACFQAGINEHQITESVDFATSVIVEYANELLDLAGLKTPLVSAATCEVKRAVGQDEYQDDDEWDFQ